MEEMVQHLSDLFRLVDEWERLQRLAQQTLGTGPRLVDSTGEVVAGEKELSPFCRLIRSSKSGFQRCQECYAQRCFSEEAKNYGLVYFRCHAGVNVVAVPLQVSEGPVGALVCGASLSEEESPLALARRLSEELGLDEQETLEAIERMPHLSDPELRAWGRMVRTLSENMVQVLERYFKLLRRESWISRLLQQRQELNIYDEVSGVYNARYLRQRLEESLAMAERTNQPLALMVVDIVGFKQINERFGHKGGNALLRQVGELLGESVRKVDLVGRYQNDEFLILLQRAEAHQAFKLAERLMARIREHSFLLGGTEVPVKVEVRVGIASSRGGKEQPHALIQRAYQALKEAVEERRPLNIYAPPAPVPTRRPRRRVVVTGLGVITPIGIGKEQFWEAIMAGKSGVCRITFFDPSHLPTQIAGEVHGFDPLQDIEPREARKMGRSTHFAIVATRMALQDSGLMDEAKRLLLEPEELRRVGVVIGCAVGGLDFAEKEHEEMLLQGAKVSPYLAINIFAGATSSEVSRHFGFKGLSITISTGCSAANDAIGYATEAIRNGEIDIAVAGGAEAPLRPLILSSFTSIRATSTRNHEPEKASRPFDKERDGFVMSEGAGIVILEELQHALRRGAPIYGEIVGYAATDDAFHMAHPDPHGEAAALAIRLALEDAGLSPRDVDYINAHGSSTPINDKTETAIIRNVFGKHAYNLAVSSTKSQVGHPIGAAGGVELAATLLAMKHQILPPTINYEVPDPECDLDYVPNHPRPGRIDVAVSNSFGFGGKNAILVVRRY